MFHYLNSTMKVENNFSTVKILVLKIYERLIAVEYFKGEELFGI